MPNLAGAGTPMRGYVVTVGGTAQGETSATGPQCTPKSCSIEVSGLSNGEDTAFTVSARNDAYPALSTWNTSAGTGRPFGPARAGGISATGTDSSGTVAVAWDAFDGKGDPILGYYVQRLSGSTVPTGAQACTVSSPAPGQVVPPRPGGIVDEQKDVSGGTHSVVFDNLLSDNGDYSFVVWGYNRAGCAATPVETVRVRPAPGPVTAVQGGMEQRGDAWDYHLTGVNPRSGIDHYTIRAGGGTGSGVDFDRTAWPRELLNGPFGEKVGFELRACSAWGSCGPWSDPETAKEESLTFTVAGLAYDPMGGQFSWTGDPSNGPSFPATYRCSVPDDPSVQPTDADSPNTCTLPGPPPPAGTVRLTVTVNAHSFDYDK